MSRDLLGGRESIVLFVDPDCEACDAFLAVWKVRKHELPASLNVFGITHEDPDSARDYARNSGFPFPLYCDDRGIFAEEYSIRVTPSAVGTYADGGVAYVGKHVTPEFTPRKAVELLEQVKRGRSSGPPQR